MSIIKKIKKRPSSQRRTQREIARALWNAPTQASRDEIYLLQNR